MFLRGFFACLVVSVSLAAQSDLFESTKRHLTHLEMELRIASSDEEIIHLLIDYQKTLRNYLKNADSETFLDEMCELDPIIEALGHRSNLFYHRFMPYKFSKAFTVTDKHGNIVCFTNTYRTDRPLSEKEKAQFFFLERNSYEEHGVWPTRTFKADTLASLEPHQIYNFVVTSDDEVRYALEYSDSTLYMTTEEGVTIKRIVSPNHTILAGNQPVLSAGTFQIWQEDDRSIIFVSNDSGHFRPDYESLKVFKNYLVELGVAPQQVILVAIEVNFENLVTVLEKRRRRAAQAAAN